MNAPAWLQPLAHSAHDVQTALEDLLHVLQENLVLLREFLAKVLLQLIDRLQSDLMGTSEYHPTYRDNPTKASTLL